MKFEIERYVKGIQYNFYVSFPFVPRKYEKEVYELDWVEGCCMKDFVKFEDALSFLQIIENYSVSYKNMGDIYLYNWEEAKFDSQGITILHKNVPDTKIYEEDYSQYMEVVYPKE